VGFVEIVQVALRKLCAPLSPNSASFGKEYLDEPPPKVFRRKQLFLVKINA